MHVRRQGEWAVVAIEGDLDMASAPALRQQVIALLGHGHRRIAVDLTGVDFVDSIGLGMLVAALKRMRSHDGELVVVCAEPRVRRLFELTDLVDVLGLVGSVEELPPPG